MSVIEDELYGKPDGYEDEDVDEEEDPDMEIEDL